jgi:energy-coupling factor transporter ATP-binding protein EcfA2
LAFFGETNAGKSTIIESLRILFKEESRQELLLQQANDMEQLSQALTVHIENVREGLLALYGEFMNELTQSTGRLKEIVQQESQSRLKMQQQEALLRQQLAEQESSARLTAEQQEASLRQQLAEQESSARLAAEQQESSQRLQIEQANALSRFKVRVALIGITGILIGAASTVALLKLAGA